MRGFRESVIGEFSKKKISVNFADVDPVVPLVLCVIVNVATIIRGWEWCWAVSWLGFCGRIGWFGCGCGCWCSCCDSINWNFRKFVFGTKIAKICLLTEDPLITDLHRNVVHIIMLHWVSIVAPALVIVPVPETAQLPGISASILTLFLGPSSIAWVQPVCEEFLAAFVRVGAAGIA